jgi:hypothetical protein
MIVSKVQREYQNVTLVDLTIERNVFMVKRNGIAPHEMVSHLDDSITVEVESGVGITCQDRIAKQFGIGTINSAVQVDVLSAQHAGRNSNAYHY